MTTDFFRMDNGSGYVTHLYRRPFRTTHIWVDAPPGDAKWEIRFDDDDGHPINVFGLPLFGEFVDSFDNLA